MKKKLFAIAILGAVAGTVAYKLKKESEDKKLLDQKLDLLGMEEKDHSEEEKKETENPVMDEINDDLKKLLDEHSDAVIHQLSESEDALDEERPIQHFVDFKSEKDLEAFKSVVIEKGYVVTRGENPLQLSVLHIAPISRSELLVNVYYLANQAIKHNGVYQGWQSRKVF